MADNGLRTFFVIFAKDSNHKIEPGILSAKSNAMAKFIGAQAIQSRYRIPLPLDQIMKKMLAFYVGNLPDLDDAVANLRQEAAVHETLKINKEGHEEKRGKELGTRRTKKEILV